MNHTEIDEILSFFNDIEELTTWAECWDLLSDPRVQLRIIDLRCQEICCEYIIVLPYVSIQLL